MELNRDVKFQLSSLLKSWKSRPLKIAKIGFLGIGPGFSQKLIFSYMTSPLLQIVRGGLDEHNRPISVLKAR